MNKRTHSPVKRIRVSLQDKVAAMLQNQQESNQVTFVFEDNTTILQELKDVFLKGKKAHQVINDLKAIQHDLNAKYFII